MEELKTKLCTEGAQALEENEEKEFNPIKEKQL